MNLKLLILLPCVLSIASISFAQKDFRKGYIVKGGDTLRGLVRYNNRNYTEAAVFKPGRRQKAVVYGTDEISAYGIFGDKRYEVITVGTKDPKKIFGLVLQKGAIDLHYAKDKFFLQKGNEQTVLQRKADSIVIGRVNQHTNVNRRHEYVYARDFHYRNQLNTLVIDCEVSSPKNLQYSRQQISKVIGDYNRCKKDFVIMKNTRPWIRVGASAAFAAYSSSSLKMDSLKGKTFKGDVSPVREFNVELRFPRAMDRFWVIVGFQPIKTTYTGSNSRTSTVQTIVDDITLTASYTKIPLSLKYSFGNPGYSFYARAGGWLSKLQSTKFTTRRTTTAGSGSSTMEEREIVNSYRNPGGVFLGLGYDQRIIGRLRLFGEVRVEADNGILGSPLGGPRASFNFISAFVGIGI